MYIYRYFTSLCSVQYDKSAKTVHFSGKPSTTRLNEVKNLYKTLAIKKTNRVCMKLNWSFVVNYRKLIIILQAPFCH